MKMKKNKNKDTQIQKIKIFFVFHRKFNPYDFVNDGGYDKMVLEL